MTGVGRCALNPPIYQCSLNFWSFQRCPESIPTRQRWLEGPSSHMKGVIKFFLEYKKILFFSKNFIGSLTTLFHWFSLSKSSLRLIQGPPRAWGMILRRNWCPALVCRLIRHVQRKFSRLTHHILEQNKCKMQSEIGWALTLFMWSLFFKSRADWWSVDNQISSLISLNVVTLEKAVVTVHTSNLDMTHVWMEICR